MVKRLLLVSLLASACFGDMVTINLPVSHDGWDHENATLLRVNLGNYINPGEQITSASLNFTGIQNYMEPEPNDRLHISLLQLDHAGQGYVDMKTYTDNQGEGNFFNGINNDRCIWVNGKSDLGYYTDDNDHQAKEEELWGKINYWEDTDDYKREYEKGLKEGFYLRYDRMISNNNHVWTKYSNWTTADFSKELNVETLLEFMTACNGWVGLGLDADCHYTGNVALEITTSPTNVPEPASMSFLLVGLASLGGVCFSRKRK